MWLSYLLIWLVRALFGAAPRWIGARPSSMQRIYFANHTSHVDTMALWAALPRRLRLKTRPVAAADYWTAGPLRRYIVNKTLHAVLIDRKRNAPDADPLEPLYDALTQGDSLIIFPEGTRQAQALPGPFKSGLYHLAQRFPQVELVPVYLDNLHRCMPKGSYFPVPLTCTVRFGVPLFLQEGEDKQVFLERARAAVTELAQ